MPVGTEDEIDVSSLTFDMPIHISPPANLRRQTLIHTIITQLMEADSPTELAEFESTGTIANATKQWIVVTHNDYQLRFVGSTATLYTEQGSTSTDLKWSDLFKAYGEDGINIGISQLRLRKSTDPGSTAGDVIGTIQYGSNANELTVTLDNDTLPANTETAIIGIINPTLSYPDDGTLDEASAGQRYLITDTVPTGGAWGGTPAGNKDDIIEYNGGAWVVSLDTSVTTDTKYVVNLTTSVQLEWTGSEWINSYEGTFNAGFWRIFL